MINTEMNVKCFYNKDGADIKQLLKESVLLYINREGAGGQNVSENKRPAQLPRCAVS